MRVASLLGAIALSAAAYFFLYRFWGGLPTGFQVAVLAAAPLVAVGAMELAARKERTLYVAGILGLVAVACFVLDLNVLGATFNVEPSPGAFLAWSAFAGLLAYAYGLSSQVAVWTSCPWNLSLQRPESLFLPGALLLLMAAFVPSRGVPRFPPLYRASGLIVLLFALFVLSNWGWNSYLPWSWGTVEVVYQVVGFVVAGLALALGNRRRWREVENVATTFFVLFLFARFFDWWWDWMPRWLFFLLIGALAVAILLALRRLRSTAHRVTA
jgi:uncharacterized membrane protein